MPAAKEKELNLPEEEAIIVAKAYGFVWQTIFLWGGRHLILHEL